MVISACMEENTDYNTIVTYPMSVGTQWVYTREVVIKQYASETSGEITGMDTVVRSNVTVTIAGTTLLNDTMHVTQFISTEDVSNIKVEEYLFLDSEGLKCYAYRNTGEYSATARKSVSAIDLSFKGLYSLALNDDDPLYYEEQPTLDVKLPLTLGSKWTYRYPNETTLLQIDKMVTGTEGVAIHNTSYSCLKVSWKYLNNTAFNGVKITDWIAAEGLVKRQVSLDRITYTSRDGESLGNAQITETLLLEAISKK